MKNILVVNVNWVGDVIFSSPIFKALKQTYPAARISSLAPLRVREILESIPQVDEVIVYDEKGEHKSFFAKLKLILQLKNKEFDAVFLLHRSFTRALIVFLAGIPQRVGYDTKGRGFLLTHKVRPLSGQVHRRDYYLRVIESYGVKVNDRSCELAVSPTAQNEITELLRQRGVGKDDFLVVVNTGGNWDLKRWPKEYFVQLMDELAGNPKVKVIIPGAGKDEKSVREIAGHLKIKPVVLAGETTLKQLAALMQRAHLVVAADTGPLHLANSVGAATIGLFGPTWPEVTGPKGKGRFIIIQNDVGCNRAPCYHLGCPDNVCMQSITVKQVIDEIKRFRN